MSLFLELPEPLQLELATQWLGLNEIACFDSSLCCRSNRSKFLNFLKILEIHDFECSKIVSASLSHWLSVRKLYIWSICVDGDALNDSNQSILFQTRIIALHVKNSNKISDGATLLLLQLISLNSKIETISAIGCDQFTDETLGCLAHHCRKLNSLSVTGCKNITDAGIQSLCQGCVNIKSLSIDNLSGVTYKSFQCIADNLPFLRHISFNCLNVFKPGAAKLQAKAFLLFLNKFESLESIDCDEYSVSGVPYILQPGEQRTYKPILGPGWGFDDWLSEGLLAALPKCAGLRSFVPKDISKEFIQQIVMRAPLLETINLDSVNFLALDETLQQIGASCRELRILSVTFSDDILEGLTSVLSKNPKLEELRVSGVFTPTCVRLVADKARHLHTFKMHRHKGVSADDIEYLQSKLAGTLKNTYFNVPGCKSTMAF